jgi:Tfp pilus assembly protein PilF
LELSGESEPENAEGWVVLAKEFLKEGKISETNQSFREACTCNPEDATFWKTYAAFLLSQGRETDAEKVGKRAIELMEKKQSWSGLRSELR